MKPKPYPSDLTGARWALLKPLFPKARPLGRPREADLRDVSDAISYRNRNGRTWRALPHDFPRRRTVSNSFARWASDGTRQVVNGALRGQVRRRAGRERHIVVDTLGLLLAVTVTAASADDGAAAPGILAGSDRERFPRLSKLWADAKYRDHALAGWAADHAWYVIEVTDRPPKAEGFV